MDCGTCVAKYVLCIFNFVFFTAGMALLSIGIWLAVDKNSIEKLTHIVAEEHLMHFGQPLVIQQSAYILIAAGAFMFIVSFLGYCGTINESQCLLTTYGIFLIIILTLEIIAGGLAAAYRDKAEEETQKFLKSTVKNFYASPNETDAVTLMWNHLMAQLQCCGVENYKDFEQADKWHSNSGGAIPKACCKLTDLTTFQLEDPSCPTSPNSNNSYFERGCYDVVIDILKNHMDILIAVAIGLGLGQVVAIFLSFCLCKCLDKGK